MTESETILEFSNVTLPGVMRGQAEMRGITFSLKGGQLMLVRVEPGNEQLPLADAAEGLLAPKSGNILWQGRSWSSFTPDIELQARGKIGRVFEKQGWLSNLNVNENVTLSQRHHTLRPECEIGREADELARYFGLPETPRRRPAFVAGHELKIAEWVRALIGRPLLLLLERPENGVPDTDLPKLIDAVQTALKRGTAVIWQTDRDLVWNTSIHPYEFRYRMRGMNLVKEA